MPSHRVLVTGAAGYIGSRVAVELLDAGHDVVPIDTFDHGDVRRIRDVPVREHDVRDDAVGDLVAETDVVAHLAAVSSVPACAADEEGAFASNVAGTSRLAMACRRTGTPLIFAGSMAALGEPVETPITADHPRNPTNFYGVTKAMAEEDVEWLAQERFPSHVLLKSNLYGRHHAGGVRVGKETVVNVFVDRALAGDPLPVHEPGSQARDFVHVKDVARAYRRSVEVLADAGWTGTRTYPIASGECLSVMEVAETVRRATRDERGREPSIEVVENPRDGDITATDFTVDTREARDAFGFEADHTVEGAVREMVS